MCITQWKPEKHKTHYNHGDNGVFPDKRQVQAQVEVPQLETQVELNCKIFNLKGLLAEIFYWLRICPFPP